MISAAETEAVAFQKENAAMRSTLSQYSIPTSSLGRLPEFDFEHVQTAPLDGASFEAYPQGPPRQNLRNAQASPQNLPWNPQSNASFSTTVSVTFDEQINASCLQVSPA